jgi:hypothetical protein
MIRNATFAGRACADSVTETTGVAWARSVLDCAGRAQRRRRFGTDERLSSWSEVSGARKRCRATLATAVQDAPGERAPQVALFCRVIWRASGFIPLPFIPLPISPAEYLRDIDPDIDPDFRNLYQEMAWTY